MTNKKNTCLTVGWREWLILPELAIPAIKAKIDTGAKTSALHAFRIETETRQEQEWVRFWIHPLQKNQELVLECESPVLDRREIKDSGGHIEERIIIETPVQLGEKSWDIEISLTCRENMLFRMLLGRTALVGAEILVDPARSWAFGSELSNQYKESE